MNNLDDTPLQGISVTVKSTSSTFTETTDAEGEVQFRLKEGENYEFYAEGGKDYFSDSESVEVRENGIVQLKLAPNEVDLSNPPQLIPFEIENADGTISESESAISPETFGYISPDMGEITFSISGTNFDKDAEVQIDNRKVEETAKVEVLNDNSFIEITFQIDEYFYSFFPEARWIRGDDENYYTIDEEGEVILVRQMAEGVGLKHTFAVINPDNLATQTANTNTNSGIVSKFIAFVKGIFTNRAPREDTWWRNRAEGDYYTGNNCPKQFRSIYIGGTSIPIDNPEALTSFSNGNTPVVIKSIDKRWWKWSNRVNWRDFNGIRENCFGTEYYPYEHFKEEVYAITDITKGDNKKRICTFLGTVTEYTVKKCDDVTKKPYISKKLHQERYVKMANYAINLVKLAGVATGPVEILVVVVDFPSRAYKLGFWGTAVHKFYELTTEKRENGIKNGLGLREINIENKKSGSVNNYTWDATTKTVVQDGRIEYDEGYSRNYWIKYLTSSQECEMPRLDSWQIGLPMSALGEHKNYDKTKEYFVVGNIEVEKEFPKIKKEVEANINLEYTFRTRAPSTNIGEDPNSLYCTTLENSEVATDVRTSEPVNCFLDRKWEIIKEGESWKQGTPEELNQSLRDYWHQPDDAPPYSHCWPRGPTYAVEPGGPGNSLFLKEIPDWGPPF
jgi:hypothetical protein